MNNAFIKPVFLYSPEQIYQFHDLLPAIIAIYFSARKFM
ncbi:hypothetical protein BACOV975_03713 [Bacteroides ovatus V975]|uniref:Uncharacterized protein n=1 Tax=Bacteroides ovatus (strain ATCC 8483 / DSM 1896 / JCM 5824 / BCRC 10623 / CCUG 4943 / NCTC 11153) TaxID=411476 RepID=A0AAN3A8Y2_BACO1|nr:hypothetical protein BACOVA_02435 [Bacteroides ovatus ATCC 8483]EEO58300.1 hypothetical protein BSCG_05230 [Bacteroides sp. 2_2_4]SCV09919.1 hypothetical protein BACOV975_03713 [Bacteroides ovatus V975]